MTVPYFTTAAMIASRTDLVAGLPSRVAEVLRHALPLKIATTTFPLPEMDVAMVWHERTEADPGGQFFRQLVVDAVQTRPSRRATTSARVSRPGFPWSS
jgi:hypothetical protein